MQVHLPLAMNRTTLLVALLVLAIGCAHQPPAVHMPVVDARLTHDPVHATRVDGGLRLQGVAGQVLANGELLIAGGSFRLIVYRSDDEGISFLPLRAPNVAASTPDIALVDGRPMIAYTAFRVVDGERLLQGVRMLHASNPDGRWFENQPVTIANLGVDPHLLALREGRLLCFVVIDDTSLGIFASDDLGATWFPLAEPIRNAESRLEDGKAIELPNGEILYAYEREPDENEPSAVEVVRSSDGGQTWTRPTPLWQPPEPADVEPGGFLQLRDGALLFFVSSNEDPEVPGTSYTAAQVRVLVSHDLGITWTMKGPVVDEPDQIVFHAFPRLDGGVGLLTIRHWDAGNRALAVYHLSANAVARLVAR